MKRGEIWTISGGSGYAGKPRPAVILQDDRFDATQSITLCGFTTDEAESSLARPIIQPTMENGLPSVCSLMVDKITTLPKTKLGVRIGRLNDADIGRLNRAIVVFLGVAS